MIMSGRCKKAATRPVSQLTIASKVDFFKPPDPPISSDDDNCECLMWTSDGLRIASRSMPRPPRPLRVVTQSSRGGRVVREEKSGGDAQFQCTVLLC
jgi:hypothetical protein